MTTLTLSRLRTIIKARKKNPNWARVDEPDNILPSFTIMIFGLIMSAFSMMLVYLFMTGQIETWIANFLAAQKTSLAFDELYAVFTAALVFLIDLLILFALALFRVPDGDDIVEMISDLDENLQERIVELENTVSQKLDRIEREVDVFEVPDDRIRSATD
jgi:hypothetical protein